MSKTAYIILGLFFIGNLDLLSQSWVFPIGQGNPEWGGLEAVLFKTQDGNYLIHYRVEQDFYLHTIDDYGNNVEVLQVPYPIKSFREYMGNYYMLTGGVNGSTNLYRVDLGLENIELVHNYPTGSNSVYLI